MVNSMKLFINKILKLVGNLLLLSMGLFIIYSLLTNFWYAISSDYSCSNEDNLFSYVLCAFVYTFFSTGLSVYKIIGPLLCLLGFVVGTTGTFFSLNWIKNEMLGNTDDGNGFITNFVMGITCVGVLYVSYIYFIESWLYNLVVQYFV